MIAPLYTLVLLESVEPPVAEDKPKFLIPDQPGENAIKTGKVLGLGSEVKDLKEGDKVLYRSWTVIEIVEKKMYLIESKDILAKELNG